MSLPRQSSLSTCVALLCVLFAGGCAVGPDFKKPAAPEVSGYTATPLAATASAAGVSGGETQRFVQGGDISADWWTLFHSAPLNELIEHSLTKNPDLMAA